MTLLPASTAILAPLTEWFSENRRSLPWRAENLDLPHPDPYAVLVSELMLQQTQVATVVPYFRRWMSRFPDPRSLESAGDDEVHKFWEGLGYYRRARFLKQAATVIAREGWPKDLEGLLALPGLGPYTAAAVASIAFQLPEPALDGNAFRVLARIRGIEDDPRRHAEALRLWLRPAMEQLGPSRVTQAVMELGATLCTPRPACQTCPMAFACEAHRLGITDRIPLARPRIAVKEVDLWLVAIHAAEHWLLLKPADRGLLSGLWRWPSLEVEPQLAPDVAAEDGAPYRAMESVSWEGWPQIYSHRKEQVHPVSVELPERFTAPEGYAWKHTRELPALPMGKRDQRLRDLLAAPPGKAASGIPAAQLIQRVMAGKP